MKFKSLSTIIMIIFFSTFQSKGQTNRQTFNRLESNRKEIFDVNSIQVEEDYDIIAKTVSKEVETKVKQKTKKHAAAVAEMDYDTTDKPNRTLTVSQLEKIVSNTRRRASRSKINNEIEKCFQSLEHESCEK